MIARVTGGSRGASWAPDDSIVFATSDATTGLMRVSARGGTPEVLTRPDAKNEERDHHFPSVLPGGPAEAESSGRSPWRSSRGTR